MQIELPTRCAVEDQEMVAREICEQAKTACIRAFGQRLLAIVLTGSLARQEATVVIRFPLETTQPVQRDTDNGERETGDGKRATSQALALLGDADFLLVFRQDGDAAGLNRIAREIECALQAGGIAVDVGLGAVAPGYFSSLPPSTFAYELKACGRVVWGDDHLLDSIPTYPPAELPKEDAWRTLNNRMIELLGCFTFPVTRSLLPADPASTLPAGTGNG